MILLSILIAISIAANIVAFIRITQLEDSIETLYHRVYWLEQKYDSDPDPETE